MSLLTYIGGDLIIVSNNALNVIDNSSFGNLNYISGSFTILHNNVLTSLVFPYLRSIGGLVNIGGSSPYSDNYVLSYVGLQAVTFVGNTILVDANPALVKVDFSSLSNVTGYIYVSSNSQLTTLNMSSLKNVNGTDTIYGTSLTAIHVCFNNGGLIVSTNIPSAGYPHWCRIQTSGNCIVSPCT